jgi:tRNA-2-methylthio-N6-dimethylallyladenosine synthase
MRPTPFQAYVRVQIGCDKFCTYCVVPSTRGPEQSRHPDHLVHEVRILVDQGCKEVTLLGQTVNSYVYDHGDGRRTRLSDLMARMHETPGLERIKFVTNYPKDMTDDLLDAVRELPKVVKYLHVPVQSGCDDVLKRMKRNYTVGFYRDMLARCREKVPGVAVSSDFIVGFCGETESSFQKSVDLIRDAKFKNSFIFKYSERPGTKAADRYPDDVPEDVKKRRNNELLEVQNANSLADHRAWIGRSVEVLVEGPSRQGQKATGPIRQLTGRTMTDHIAVFDGSDRLIGHTVTLDVTDASAFTLYGQVRTGESVGVNEVAATAREIPPTASAATPARRIGLALV